MLISCPSCGVQYKSEDYGNDFEIQCSCGYALLLPDLEAFSKPQPNTQYANSPPSALAESDPAELLNPSSTPDAAKDSANQIVHPLQGSLEMTPAEQLPEGMIYDPFELPADASSESPQPAATTPVGSPFEDADAGADFSGELAGLKFEEAPDDVLGSAEDSSAAASESSFPPKGHSAAKSQEDPPPLEAIAPTEELLQRVQLGTMGQFVGALFTIECAGLEKSDLEQIRESCGKLFKARPWLETLVSSRGADLNLFVKKGRLGPIPESLAVEIYLKCFELGGNCSFKKH